jgi:hypothetical protein
MNHKVIRLSGTAVRNRETQARRNNLNHYQIIPEYIQKTQLVSLTVNLDALAICHSGSDLEPESSLLVIEIMDLPAVQLRQAGPRQKHSLARRSATARRLGDDG